MSWNAAIVRLSNGARNTRQCVGIPAKGYCIPNRVLKIARLEECNEGWWHSPLARHVELVRRSKCVQAPD